MSRSLFAYRKKISRKFICGALLSGLAVWIVAPEVAQADPIDDSRDQQFCGYLRMNGYVVKDCQWLSVVAMGQCAGLMDGRTYLEMMNTSRIMAPASTRDAQWAILKTAVNVYCPMLDPLLPMSP